jgi:hypothetical protein
MPSCNDVLRIIVIYEGLVINNVVKVLTIPLSHPTKAVALFSIPEMLDPVVLKLLGKKLVVIQVMIS